MIRAILLRLSRRPWRFLLPVLLLLFFALTLNRTRHGPPRQQSPYTKLHTKSFFPPLKSASSSSVDPDYCANFPTSQLDNIQVVLKTGAGDKQKSRAHLSTVTSCISNILIVSDHDEKIGDHPVVDVLAELPASYAVNNTDFQAYADHKKAHAEGDTVDYAVSGWKLDRFKYLPMVDKAYELNPTAKWYVFLETNTYFFWDTLFRLLDQLKSTDLHYMGAPGPVSKSNDRDYIFGQAGFVLSQGLMKKLLPPKASGGFDKLSHRYEENVKNDCCGDAVLAYAILNTTDTRLESLHPTFSGEDLREIKVDRERWCVPLLSLHKIAPEQMEKLWKWERTRPYTIVRQTSDL
jgi:hypothetical protein